MLINLISHL